MSKTGAINISFKEKGNDNFNLVLNALLNNQWSLNKHGYIFFMLNGSYNFQSAPISESAEVISNLQYSIDNKKETCVDLIWKDGATIIGLLFIDNIHMIITISENIKLNEVKNSIDFPFYIEKLSPIFEFINYDDIKCEFN
jgi:hypothetical protein